MSRSKQITNNSKKTEVSRKRIRRERSTPNSVISRLYTSSKQMKLTNTIQLVTVLINSTDRLQKPYVRTQLAIATCKSKKGANKAARMKAKK